ncbi:MAG: hypothetical protein H7257_10260 [Taibaiella sp.]|nr:hypothetical protein [Taibaiella sp.]
MSIAGYSQAGALSIVNNNKICKVWVVMKAEEPLGGFPTCSLQGNQFFVPNSTTTSFPSHGAFTSAVGWLIGGPGPVAPATDFMWNECRFQFVCPLTPPCSGMGTYVNSRLNPPSNCNPGQNNIPSAGGCVPNVNWSPDPSGVMTNITVTFN